MQYQYISVGRFSFTQPIYIAYYRIGEAIKSKRAITMSKKVLHTKFGIAKIDRTYFRISTNEKGNYNKYLHRLIFEDFYGMEIPDGYVVHHKDGNKLNNCILNLQLLREFDHRSLHHEGTTHSAEAKKKMSKAKKGKYRGPNNHMYKDYARVVKLDNRNGVQRYVIKKDKKSIKSSTNPLFLTKWFKENYPDEKLENRFEDLGWEDVKKYQLRPKGHLNGKKRYCIRYDGKVLRQSVFKDRLIEWFKENYPNEELEVCK